MNLTKVNLRRVRPSIRMLLNSYNEVVFGYHKQILSDFCYKLCFYEEMNIIENEHGRHLTECGWNIKKATEGSDTCNCESFCTQLREAIEILRIYRKVLSHYK